MRSLLLIFVTLLTPAPFARAEEREPPRIIFDTDMDSDCDDAGALAMLHVLADRGEAELLATICSARHAWSPACVDAINGWYGRPDLPIGVPREGATTASKYARELAESFPHDTPTDLAKIPSSVDVYRRALSAQPDGSVTIVTVGDLTNVAALLKAPAEGDQPSGRDLAAKKVKLWVCMGGNFIGRPAVDDLKLGNNNFTVDAESSYEAVRNWPGEIVFVGREIGSVPSGLAVGARLKELPENHPVRFAYAAYFGGEPRDRHVADQTAVLYAVRGLGPYWGGEVRGTMHLARDMTFRFEESADGGHRYVVQAPLDSPEDDARVEQAIEELMTASPAAR
ncbi:MAG TPA: nucleoside hydrolase [Pirellulaceae bacterium]|jgi:hypothetical protein|nr:nucleoside hydrolase [Pirellulaceae bacterium]